MAILTSIDDDSVGERIYNPPTGDVSTGNPVITGATYLQVGSSSTGLRYLRILYAGIGVRQEGTTDYQTGVPIWHCQFLKCQNAIGANAYYDGYFSLNLYNVLISQCVVGLTNLVLSSDGQSYLSGSHLVLYGEHVTADQVHALFFTHGFVGAYQVGNTLLKNSILTAVDYQIQRPSGDADIDYSIEDGVLVNMPATENIPTDHCVVAADGSAIYQSSGLGNYYLKAASCRNAGATPNIYLRRDLTTKTTQPPIIFPAFMEVTGELTLFPQVPRYVSGAPDLGYWYDALDYTVADMFVDGGTIIVEPGTAIGIRQDYVPGASWPWDYTYMGFVLQNSSSFVSHGIPDHQNVFASARLVQETPDINFGLYKVSHLPFDTVSFYIYYYTDSSASSPPSLDFRFSSFFAPSDAYHVASGSGIGLPSYDGNDANSSMSWTLRDCSVFGGRIGLRRTDNQYAVYPNAIVSWINNLFDRTDITVVPTWYPNNGMINVDLAFQAWNNLFRGQQIYLDPIPATQGHWLFKDNLFDKAGFRFYKPSGQPNWTGPIDHDFNGYWQRTSGELESGQVSRLTANNSDGSTDAVNDKVLASAPAYQTGPLGNYYLASSSPLYQSSNPNNRGSRSVAEAGVYHYTTRADQTKDGAQSGNVIIGHHYVATANSSSTVPKDTDSDGIADFVENWHGDGDTGANRVHTTDETDWQNAHTTTGMNDSVNTIYDDIDLDGDGMVGRIEKALKPSNPQTLVPDNPLVFNQITPGPDITSFVVPVNYDSATPLGKLRLSVDGNPVEIYEVIRNTDGNCLVKWNTTFTSPGEHFISLAFCLFGQVGGLQQGDDTPDPTVLSADGPAQEFSVNSVLRFDPFYSEFSDSGGLFYAELAIPEAQYTIELYDPSKDPEDPPFKTITGTTVNGQIKQSWDGKDDDNHSYAGDSIRAVFTVSEPGQQLYSLPDTHTMFLDRGVSLGDGDFTVAFAWNVPAELNSMRLAVQLGVVDILMNPYIYGIGDGYQSPHNTPSSGGFGGNAGYLSSQADSVTLKDNYLANVNNKNFYFRGHGSSTSVGDGADGVAGLDAGQVGVKLGNRVAHTPSGFDYNSWLTRGHPYRFVWLDACGTADDPGWATAFGIRQNITPNFVEDIPLAVQAFVGWVGEPRAPTSNQDWDDYGQMLGFVFLQWMQDVPLRNCLSSASKRDPFGDGSLILNWPLGKKFTIFHGLFNSNKFRYQVYGYDGITRHGYQ